MASTKLPNEVSAFFLEIAKAEKERAPYVDAVPDALDRLAKAAYGHDNSQAQTVTAVLASIYNGEAALPVRLDALRHLDWALLKDLLAVMVGIGHKTPDEAIRKAFEKVGGEDGVAWLHWHTAGGPHLAALRRLATFCAQQRSTYEASLISDILDSLADGSANYPLARLQSLNREQASDMLLVVDGLYGKDRGLLEPFAISEALREAASRAGKSV